MSAEKAEQTVDQNAQKGQEPEHQSWLDWGLDGSLGRASRAVGFSNETSKGICDFTKSIGTKIPFFIPGRTGYVLTGIAGALDEADVNDGLGMQAFEGLVGGSRACAIKKLYTHMGNKEMASSTRGVVTGFAARGLNSLTHASTWKDSDGSWSFATGLSRTTADVLNPEAILTDVVLWSIADYAEGRLNLPTAGAFRRSPVKPMILSASVFGATQSSMEEISRQYKAGEELSFGSVAKVAGMGLFGGCESALCAGPGAYLNMRRMNLPKTPFNQGEGAKPAKLDDAQVRMREGTFEPTRDLDPRSMKVKATFGNVVHADGTTTEAIFRFNDGSAEFARRQSAETSAYALVSRLGMPEVAPITVPREITVNGVKHEGYVQEVVGRSLDQVLKQEAQIKYGSSGPEAVEKLLASSPQLMEGIQRAMIARQIGAEHDNHGQNFTVATNQDGTIRVGPDGLVRVANVDLNFTFPEAQTKLDLIPRREKELSVVDLQTGVTLRRLLQGTPIPATVRDNLSTFTQQYRAQPEQLLDTGLAPKQIEGALGRTEWFAERGMHPENYPNYAWLAYVKYRALLVNKPQPDLTPPGEARTMQSPTAAAGSSSLGFRLLTLPIEVMKLPYVRKIFP